MSAISLADRGQSLHEQPEVLIPDPTCLLGHNLNLPPNVSLLWLGSCGLEDSFRSPQCKDSHAKAEMKVIMY